MKLIYSILVISFLDEEIVAYKTPAECVDKVRFLLNNPNEMVKIATAGQTKTLNEYTYASRIVNMINVL